LSHLRSISGSLRITIGRQTIRFPTTPQFSGEPILRSRLWWPKGEVGRRPDRARTRIAPFRLHFAARRTFLTNDDSWSCSPRWRRPDLYGSGLTADLPHALRSLVGNGERRLVSCRRSCRVGYTRACDHGNRSNHWGGRKGARVRVVNATAIVNRKRLVSPAIGSKDAA
jgi:hypothetical protein